jgi:diguanylate cyclase (GGDEF)-like protein
LRGCEANILKESVSVDFIGQSQKINRLRWLFTGVFLLVCWFGLSSNQRAPCLLILAGVAVLFLLFFEWFYHQLARGKFKHLGNRALMNLFFGHVVLDIGLISIGTCLTGGVYSLLPLVYILYFGVLEIFFRPLILLGLNGLALSVYLGLVYFNACRVFDGVPGWVFLDGSGYGFVPVILVVLILNAALVALRSRQIHGRWQQIKSDNDFLTELTLLSRTAIADVNDRTAFVGLADKIKLLLGADHIYFTRWDEDGEQIVSLAADAAAHEFYVKLPPTPAYENTFTRSVRQAGRVLVAENVYCSPYLSPRFASIFSAKSIVAAPMISEPNNRFLGALFVAFDQRHYFSSLEIARIRQVLDILSLLISRTMLYEEAIRRAELLEKMAGQVTNLVSDLKHTTLLPSIVESARSLLQAQRAALHLQQGDGQMKCEYSVGLSDDFLEQLTRRFNQLAGGKILKNREYVIIPDVSQDSRTSPVQDLIYGEKFRAYAVFSLNPEDEQKGALTLYWDTPFVISKEEIMVGKLFAERASAIIRSAVVYARVAEEALTDILTELPNRRHLDQRIQQEIERSSRYGHIFAVLMLDLDGFKGINDTFGHLIGDSVLKQVATVLRRTLRASDFLARYGGDEFCIILPETGLERALMVSEKLRLSLASTHLHLPQETQRYLSGCMGIAIYPQDRQTAEEILICADQRMYCAKRSGSGSIIYADE